MRTILKTVDFWLKKAILSLIMLIFSLNMPTGAINAILSQNSIAALTSNNKETVKNLFMVVGGDSLLAENHSLSQKTMKVVITGYSSTPDQTDDTPFITASNTKVRDGIIAANFLAFGTRIQIPDLFGDKIFTVEDRMAKKHNGKIDIWFPERQMARNFGIREADVIVLQ